MRYKINTPYKRGSSTGGLIISRNNQSDKKYKVVSYDQYGYGCVGYAATYYFQTLKLAIQFLRSLCNEIIHETLSPCHVKRFTN
jgi:hypothetical protein